MKQEINETLRAIIVDAVDGTPVPDLDDIVRVLGSVWFAELTFWSGGLTDATAMADHLARAAHPLRLGARRCRRTRGPGPARDGTGPRRSFPKLGRPRADLKSPKCVLLGRSSRRREWSSGVVTDPRFERTRALRHRTSWRGSSATPPCIECPATAPPPRIARAHHLPGDVRADADRSGHRTSAPRPLRPPPTTSSRTRAAVGIDPATADLFPYDLAATIVGCVATILAYRFFAGPLALVITLALLAGGESPGVGAGSRRRART